MKRNPAPRNESIRSAIRSANGIRRINVRNCGTSTTPGSNKGESIRVFPLSNWTELDVWQYIHLENIPIVPLYFAKERDVVMRGESLLSVEQECPAAAGRKDRRW